MSDLRIAESGLSIASAGFRVTNYKAGLRSLMLLVVLLIFAGCGRPEPQPLSFNDAPWKNGEASFYDITDINGKYAGTILYSLHSDGVRVPGNWLVQREINAQGDLEVIQVEIKADSFYPLHTLWTLENGSGQEVIDTSYNDGTVDMVLTSKQKQMHTEQRTIPTDSFDAYTLMMLLRALPLADDYATEMNVFTPLTGKLEFITLSVLKQEEVTTTAGTYQAWVVEVKRGDNRSKAWIGTDAPHPVVKYMDAGNGGSYELTTFEAG